MCGRGDLDRRDEGKFHFLTLGVEFGEGDVFLLKVQQGLLHKQGELYYAFFHVTS